MKLIMENWRKFLKIKKTEPRQDVGEIPSDDHPADGLTPVDPKSFDTHAGGLTGAPIKDRKTLMIDPYSIEAQGQTYVEVGEALEALENDINQFLKSDRNFQDPNQRSTPSGHPTAANPRSQAIAANLEDRLTDQERELTYLEGAETITGWEAEQIRKRLDSFRQILAHVDTVDIDLFHIGKEIRQTKDEITEMLRRKK